MKKTLDEMVTEVEKSIGRALEVVPVEGGFSVEFFDINRAPPVGATREEAIERFYEEHFSKHIKEVISEQ